jgi:hypothetical protein
MSNTRTSVEQELKHCTNENLIKALNTARQRADEAWDSDGTKIWAERAQAYATELTRRYNANKAGA